MQLEWAISQWHHYERAAKDEGDRWGANVAASRNISTTTPAESATGSPASPAHNRGAEPSARAPWRRIG